MPETVLCGILEFLPAEEVLNSVSRLDKYFWEVVRSNEYLLGQLVRRRVRTERNLRQDWAGFCRTLKALAAPQAWLDFTGFGTTGGYDEDQPIYWVSNLYQRDDSYYCSRDNRNNINTVGVLKITQAESQDNAAYAYLSRVFEKCHVLAVSVYPRFKTGPLNNWQIRHFVSIFREHRRQVIQLVANDLKESEETVERDLTQAVKSIKTKKLDIVSLKRRSEDSYVMFEKIDTESADNSRKIAFITKVEVSREGGFTCPVECFMVFVSEKYIDIEDDEFTRYNDIRTYERLKNAFPDECGTENGNENFVYSEFKPTSRALKPVVWGKFLTRQTFVISVSLENGVLGNYLYMKLINPENRMAEMGDMHDFTNIDCSYVAAQGNILTLGSLNS
jgi:hypothetical protein